MAYALNRSPTPALHVHTLRLLATCRYRLPIRSLFDSSALLKLNEQTSRCSGNSVSVSFVVELEFETASWCSPHLGLVRVDPHAFGCGLATAIGGGRERPGGIRRWRFEAISERCESRTGGMRNIVERASTQSSLCRLRILI